MHQIQDKPHFHIFWDDRHLDWECFGTREEANMRAQELARPGEIFTIEEISDAQPHSGPNAAKVN